MLKFLRIRNFVLIAEADLEFEPGLVAITGETGAGKTILLEALSLVLGERASPNLVREGADSASVEAVFEYIPTREPGRSIEALLSRSGLERRRPGSSCAAPSPPPALRCFVNGSPWS
ncbi:AAA family ATPase [bacterium]|nr:AAA family ATPase [bacterium]